MDMIKRFDPLWIFLLVVGGLNWAIVALFDTNVVTEIFGTGTASDVVYVMVGFAALMWVPRMFEGMQHMHRPMRPHGT